MMSAFSMRYVLPELSMRETFPSFIFDLMTFVATTSESSRPFR